MTECCRKSVLLIWR